MRRMSLLFLTLLFLNLIHFPTYAAEYPSNYSYSAESTLNHFELPVFNQFLSHSLNGGLNHIQNPKWLNEVRSCYGWPDWVCFTTDFLFGSALLLGLIAVAVILFVILPIYFIWAVFDQLGNPNKTTEQESINYLIMQVFGALIATILSGLPFLLNGDYLKFFYIVALLFGGGYGIYVAIDYIVITLSSLFAIEIAASNVTVAIIIAEVAWLVFLFVSSLLSVAKDRRGAIDWDKLKLTLEESMVKLNQG